MEETARLIARKDTAGDKGMAAAGKYKGQKKSLQLTGMLSTEITEMEFMKVQLRFLGIISEWGGGGGG